MQPKILITGGDSFIAKSITPMLVKEGYRAFCFKRADLNLLDSDLVLQTIKAIRPTFVIHTAVAGNGRDTDKIDYFYENCLMLENIMEAEEHYRKLVVFDSAASFNRKTDINRRKEGEYYTVPKDYYGFSKYINYRRYKTNGKTICFRVFNLFGPLELESRFIKTCIRNCKENKQIVIPEDKYFDFFYIDHFFSILNAFIKEPPKRFCELNLSYLNKQRLSDAAEVIKTKLNSKSKINVNYTGFNYCGDGQKLLQKGFDFGSFAFHNGIEEMLKCS